MGCSSSRIEKNEALRLCEERKRFIKKAIHSRYALAAAHLCYIQSLQNIGIALRRFAEAEVLVESSLSTSATELDKTPSHSSFPSPSPSHNAGTVDSPLHNENAFSSPLSTLSYMRSGGSAALTVSINPPLNSSVDDESLTFPLPPPPPFPEAGSSWDFFDPTDETESFRFMGEKGFDKNIYNSMELSQFRGEEVASFMVESAEKRNGEIFVGSARAGYELRLESSSDLAARSKSSGKRAMTNACFFNGSTSKEQRPVDEGKLLKSSQIVNGSAETLAGDVVLEQSSSKKKKTGPEKDFCVEREDPSEFITHRAKDFLASIKDIEHRFFRASESGKEVSRMLETSKIRLSCSEAKGGSPTSVFVAALDLVCCRCENVPHETLQDKTKVITWNRSTSSQSSSSRNPLTTASKDDIDDSGSDFVEEFCMIAGCNSSTLDRIYAWEMKLYDEVKASLSIKKLYDQKCDQLRREFARDQSPKVIDKTRAVVKDLYSRIRVAIHAVDSIAKRIEKLRDEELQPQLVELIQGLIRMWKVMLECHHAQHITITLAYHAKSSTSAPPQGDSHRQVLAHLQHEIECFGSSSADWINAHRSYIEALNGWLQNCILQPQERSKGRKVICPRKALAPPIFVLCLDWSARIKDLPSVELLDAIKAFASDVHNSMEQQVEEQQKNEPSDLHNNGESENREEGEKPDKSLNLSSIDAGLTKVLVQLTKFAEDSLKMYEDIRQGSDAARFAYTNGRNTIEKGGVIKV